MTFSPWGSDQVFEKESFLFFRVTFHKLEITVKFKDTEETNSLFSCGVHSYTGFCWWIAAKEISNMNKPSRCLDRALQVDWDLPPLDPGSGPQIYSPQGDQGLMLSRRRLIYYLLIYNGKYTQFSLLSWLAIQDTLSSGTLCISFSFIMHRLSLVCPRSLSEFLC